MGFHWTILVSVGVWCSDQCANRCRFPAMFESVGVARSAGVIAALIMGVSFIPIALLHWQGKRWYARGGDE